MAEGVAADAFGELGGDGGLADSALQDGFVEMVATAFTGGLVEVGSRRGEEPLPGPFTRRSWVFGAEGVGYFDEAGTSAEVRLVLLANEVDVFAKARDERQWERSEAVFAALAVTHADFTTFEVDVFDTQARAFQEAQARAVQERSHEANGAVEASEQEGDFAGGEDYGDAFGAFGSNER